MQVDVVIVAAGTSTRFGERDKLSADICGMTVLARSLAAYEASPRVATIVLVTAPQCLAEFSTIARAAAPTKYGTTVAGGARRRDSVEAGLRACTTRYAAIHDGARPLVTREVIERVISAAEGRSGAIAAIPVADTIKEVQEGTVMGHPDRARLWAAQTPQVVLRQAWLDAATMSDNDETDDAAMLSRLGLECAVVEGSWENLKITRPVDIAVAEAILRARGEA